MGGETRPLPPNRNRKQVPKMNKTSALAQAEATLRAAEQTAARAAERIVALSNRPDEPTTDDPDGALVLWFKRTFNGGMQYTYSAVKAGSLWYLTGPRIAAGKTWDEFLDWLDDDLITPLWQATDEGWQEVL